MKKKEEKTMKILFFGDSITDASRIRDNDDSLLALGGGYVRDVASLLYAESPNRYVIRNRGISGNRIVDLYSRVKADCTNLEPDVLTILVGVNDVWHEVDFKNGVDISRFEKIYRMLLDDVLERLPNIKIILMEPYILEGSATKEAYEELLEVKEYAKVVKTLAEEYGLPFVALQEKFDECAKQYGVETYLKDGVHPTFAGGNLIAREWLKLFKEKIEK